VIPPRVPEEDNFAATGFWTKLFAQKTTDWGPEAQIWSQDAVRKLKQAAAPIRDPRTLGQLTNTWYHVRWHLTDLPALEKACRNLVLGETNRDLELPPITDAAARATSAEAVLDYLKVSAPVLEELGVASQRPQTRFNVDYHVRNPLLIQKPHWHVIHRLCQALELKAAAELALGRSDRALEDVGLILRLADGVREEPFRSSYLSWINWYGQATRVVWEGLAYRGWSEGQLHHLQSRFQSCDFLKDYQDCLRRSRALENGFYLA
jgi:hypothetical protein